MVAGDCFEEETVTISKPSRSAGVLLHPTSLPSPYGIGDLGSSAYQWVEMLARARQKWWQILPLGPTGFGDSPYQSFSAFAGNPYLLSPEFLARDGLLQEADLAAAPSFPADRVDYGPVIQFKLKLLNRAWENYQRGLVPALRGSFDEFCARNRGWLDDYAMFMAIKGAHGGASWHDWPTEFRLRKTDALLTAKSQLADPIGRCRFGQFLFFRQWRELKKFANDKGIKLLGDAPIFVSSDSADVWANPQFFLLDEQRRPKAVAGVPPDYFSATGQLWGNPLYDWDALRRTEYAWWINRLKATLEQVDVVRIDHFRGFEAYWEVPAGMPTAEHGRWVKAPGIDLFEHIKKAMGNLPLVAEDLGIITPEVEALRDRFGLPGMKILQFAFGDKPDNPYLPHNYYNNVTVAYTGTHDNDTTRGWFESLPDWHRDNVRHYLARDGGDIVWDFIRLAWSSVADCAIAPLQDVLNLPSSARMNSPGRAAGNWGWRFTPEMLDQHALDRLADMTTMYAR